MRYLNRHTLGLGVSLLAIVIGVWGVHHVVSGHDRQTTTTKVTHTTTTASSTSTNAAATQRAAIQSKVQAYLTKVGADQTVSVTFKNLTPKAGSDAAKDPIYNTGSLTASVNGDIVETSASTYKLFIAAYLFSHNYTWTDTAKTGFNNMVVNSANDFSEGILAEYGASTIDSYLTSQGWNNVFDDDRAAETTSNTLASVLTNLQAGTGAFSDSSLQSWLLSDMAKQVYRDGIPAAAGSGATVQDKVGFLDDVNNDAAIVTMPNGARFILVIMTHGHNQATLDFSRINTIAKQVIKLAYGA